MEHIKVFVSSLMGGDFAQLRDAACDAITSLGYEVLRAEDFSALPASPQNACLAEVRSAEVLVLILGSQYGHRQVSGLSATHEEYREARRVERQVLVFIEENAQPVSAQAEFIAEVQDWATGHYTSFFRDANDLRAKVTQGLHNYLLNQAAHPIDESELLSRARSLISSRTHMSRPLLVVAVAAGPVQQVIRPADLESEKMRQYLKETAHAGPDAVLSYSYGTDTSIKGDAISLKQRDSGAAVTLSETGDIMVAQPATRRQQNWVSGIPSIVEEEITEGVTRALRFVVQVLDRINLHQRISHVAPVAALREAAYLPWRTREERDHNPNTVMCNSLGQDQVEAVLSPPTCMRAALSNDTTRLSQDLTIKL